MAYCEVHFDSLEDMWQWMIWLAVSTLIYTACRLFWNPDYYARLRGASKQLPPVAWIDRILSTSVIVAASYAAWRAWSCGNWDEAPLRFFFYMLWLLAYSLRIPVMFLARDLIADAIIVSAACLLSITVLVFFLFADVYAGVVFIVITTILAMYTLLHWYIAGERKIVIDKMRYFATSYGPADDSTTHSASAVYSNERHNGRDMHADAMADDIQLHGETHTDEEKNHMHEPDNLATKMYSSSQAIDMKI